MKIGNVEIKSKALLAPMAGINDVAFRILCKRFGAGLVYTEMINANAIVRNNKSTFKKFILSSDEKPMAVQLFGAKEDMLIKAAKIIQDSGADIIDFNLGCPDRKVLRQGAGAALLKRPKKVGELINALVKSVKIPVTVKIRLSKNYLEIAKIAQDNGASAIALHARTIKQGYSGKADWSCIKKLKENLSIPVIGSGDVFNGEDAKRMLEETGCDFVMVGRGAIGNPQVFREINDYLDNKEATKMSDKEKLNLFFNYLELADKYNLIKLPYIRRQALNFTKGVSNSVSLRGKISKAKSIEEIKKIINNT